MQVLIHFWRRHPALSYSVSLLLGLSIAFYSLWTILFALCLFWAPIVFGVYRKCVSWLTIGLNASIMGAGFFYGFILHEFTQIPEQGLTGIAQLEIKEIVERKQPFGYTWTYRCRLKTLVGLRDSQLLAKNLDCLVSFPHNDAIQRPPANMDYLVQGTLKQTPQGLYFFKPSKDTPWYPLSNSWNSAEQRYAWKKHVKHWIEGLPFTSAQAASFLSGLVTGQFDDPQLVPELSRFGLQHLMAISGFHFSILASMLTFLLGCILPQKMKRGTVIALLSLYYLFLGWGPSIVRAWIMISLGLIAFSFRKTPQALNLLGVALLVCLIVDPLLCQTIGFQFSFLVTAAILLLHTPFDQLLSRLLTKRPLSQLIEMNGWNQHAYCLLALFRQSLALGCAVNSVAIPLALYHFHQFPLMSLVYNLFYPFLVSLSMFFLLVGFLLGLIWPLIAEWVHVFNGFYTDWILNLIYGSPKALDLYIQVESYPDWVLIAYLSVTFSIAIYTNKRSTLFALN
jgi:competence protein ComEC